MQVTFYGAFVNWLTNRTLTPTPLPRERGSFYRLSLGGSFYRLSLWERGSFYRLSLWERPARESAAGEGRGCHLFSECVLVKRV